VSHRHRRPTEAAREQRDRPVAAS